MSSRTKFTIQITTKAQKDIRKLDHSVRERIVKAIQRLKTNRHPQQFKPIVGKNIAQFRIRAGDYRILYDIYNQDRVVLILRVGHRKETYK